MAERMVYVKRTWKRILSVLLVLLMLIGGAPLESLAEVDWSILPKRCFSGKTSSGLYSVCHNYSGFSDFFGGFHLNVSAANYNGSCGENITWSLDTVTGELAISGIGIMTYYSSANSVPWYSHRTSVKTVTIGDGVTTITNWAFSNCINLESVTLGKSVKTIGNYVFQYCRKLSDVYYLGSLSDSNAIQVATQNESFTGAKWHYSNSSGTCGDNIAWVLDMGVLTISGTGEMQNYLGTGSPPWQYSWYTVKDVRICTGVTSIGNYAFNDCTSISNISIADSVTKIGYGAFEGCTSLANVTIGSGMINLGESLFYDCSSLVNITVHHDNSVYSSVNGVLYNKAQTALLCYPACKPDTSFTIPDSVTNIGNCAFLACRNLENISIPDSVTTIGGNAFANCTNLKDIEMPNSVTAISSWMFLNCKRLNSFIIPNSVTEIGNGAFEGCISLASIAIPDSVTRIGNYAFEGCTWLQSITMPDSVSSIGNDAFKKCVSLTSITIPESVTCIGSGVFNQCIRLESLTLPFVWVYFRFLLNELDRINTTILE